MLGSRRLIAAAASCLLLVAFASSRADAHHSWNGYHWARTANPFAVSLGDNVTSAWDSYLRTTSVDWTASTVVDTPITAGRAGSVKRCAPSAGRIEVCNSTYGTNGWLGIAQVWASGSHITQGTVKLNDTYFNKAPYNTPAWKNLVACQEVGHTLGLDHQDENFENADLNTCMDYSNNAVPNQHPNSHDYDQLIEIYGHLDTTNTIGSSAATSPGSAAGNTASEWGRSISKSPDGRSSLYKRTLADGQVVFTHVFWAR